MKRNKLKPFVIPSFLSLVALIALLTGALLPNKKDVEQDKPHTYVSDSIISNDTAVIKTDTKIINPYTDQAVTLAKSYYDYKSDAKTQENSIIYHDNTYMQNSGIDFTSENTFECIAVLNGEVTNVKEDETLGKIVEIKHDNDYISIYQSLSEVLVKKGDIVSQGQVIGKSGINELDKEIGNHLHFEFYVNGQVVDPSLYLNKELNTKSE